ncbi:LytR C-terminal domain-containing protein [Actinomycetaceae bacterium MB13-C1-2]|nr:LytR C-terminal domain-containing protein [Actinomycetaceae bacterium MB13-C1-2]
MSDYQDEGRQVPTPGYVEISPRQQYRRARTRRKTIIFGSSILGLGAAFVLGYLALQGSFAFPVEPDFHRTVEYAEPGNTPCPSDGARPVATDDVQVLVYNTTQQTGLAGTVATYLHNLGYYVGATGNSDLYRGSVQIETGPRGVDAAYTIARFFGPDTRIKLNASEDKTLTILIGERFGGIPTAEETEAIINNSFALVPADGCLPVAEPTGGWDVPENLLDWQQSAIEQREAEEAAKEEAPEG